MLKIQVPTRPRDHQPAIYPANGTLRHGYSQFYGGTAHIQRVMAYTHYTMPSNDVVPSQPGGRTHGTVYGPPSPVSVLHHLYSLP
jgi:hypothetical protein